MNRLLSTVVHEVRNPLGVINLHAELILKNPGKAAMSAEVISRTSADLERILTELLDYSRPLTLETARNDIARAVNETICLIRPSYEDAKVELALENRLEEKALISFDRIKIFQALFNLLKNALEASKPGDKVEILLKRERDDVLIRISDQGPGIPVENREKIFEPFFTTRKKGTGIGLARTKKILEVHDGSLCIDPDKTGGAAFIIKLKGG